MRIASRIHEFWTQVKYGSEQILKTWGTVFIIFLVGLSSFGLGRLSAGEGARPAVSISHAEAQEPRGMAVGGLVIASRSGSVYHYPWCGGASQIKVENQLWYASEEAAQKAGYSPSKNCRGLGEEQ